VPSGERPPALAEEICLVSPEMVEGQPIRRTLEMFRELLDRVKVGVDRRLRVVAPLKLLQHRLSEMGHRNLLVTHTLLDRSSAPHA
jgi:hypothetical protein